MPQKVRKKISTTLTGIVRSEETCARISESKKNPSQEIRMWLSKAARGRKWTEKTRAIQAIARKGRVFSEETKGKLSVKAKEREERKRQARLAGSHVVFNQYTRMS